MRATIRVVDEINDVSEALVSDHKFEFGGPGDGFCYSHQSFKCLDNLSTEEKRALNDADYIDNEEEDSEDQEQAREGGS